MSAIDKVRQARGIDELAGQIEPLAQSLATLADKAVTAIEETQNASITQAGEWKIQQGKAAKAWKGTANGMKAAANGMKAAAEALDKAAGKAEGAASQLGWRIFVVTSMGFLLFMLVLLIGLWLWLTPELRTTKEGAVWLLLRLK